MKEVDFLRALQAAPFMAPVFEVTRVYPWMQQLGIGKGDRVLAIGGHLYPEKWGGGGLGVTAGHLRFVGYEDIGDWLRRNGLTAAVVLQ